MAKTANGQDSKWIEPRLNTVPTAPPTLAPHPVHFPFMMPRA